MKGSTHPAEGNLQFVCAVLEDSKAKAARLPQRQGERLAPLRVGQAAVLAPPHALREVPGRTVEEGGGLRRAHLRHSAHGVSCHDVVRSEASAWEVDGHRIRRQRIVRYHLDVWEVYGREEEGRWGVGRCAGVPVHSLRVRG